MSRQKRFALQLLAAQFPAGYWSYVHVPWEHPKTMSSMSMDPSKTKGLHQDRSKEYCAFTQPAPARSLAWSTTCTRTVRRSSSGPPPGSSLEFSGTDQTKLGSPCVDPCRSSKDPLAAVLEKEKRQKVDDEKKEALSSLTSQ